MIILQLKVFALLQHVIHVTFDEFHNNKNMVELRIVHNSLFLLFCNFILARCFWNVLPHTFVLAGRIDLIAALMKRFGWQYYIYELCHVKVILGLR
jgi:hypothetical protein